MRDYLVFRHEDDYAHERTEMMDKFGYKTIPMVIQNIHNINFNVRLFNEYKSAPESYKMTPLFPEELDAIRIYGVMMLQQYVIMWSPGHELHNLPIHHRGMSTALIYPTAIPDDNVGVVPESIKTDDDDEDVGTTTARVKTEDSAARVKTEDSMDESVHPVPPRRFKSDDAPTETINAMTEAKWNIHRATPKSKSKKATTPKKLKGQPHPTPKLESPPLRTEPGLDKIMSMCEDSKYLWMGDSGSSCHFTNDDSGLFDWRPIKEGISLGDGRTVYATKIGTLRLEVHQRNGTKCIVYLPECKYIKSIPTNLFSITRALAHGWNLRNNGVQLVLTNQDQKIVFDSVESTATGFVMKVKMVPLPPQKRTSELMCSMTTRSTKPTRSPPPSNEVVRGWKKELKAQRDFAKDAKIPIESFYPKCHNCHHPGHKQEIIPPNPTEWQLVVNSNKIKPSQPTIKDGIDINEYHGIFGHVNGKILQATAKYYNIGLSGNLKTCLACSLAKIPKSPISREHNDRSTIPGERIFVDISYFPQPSIAGNQYWILIVDDATDMAWSVFVKHKSDLGER